MSSFLRATWSNLVAINYVVDPGMLSPLVPEGVELDSFGGKCFVSLVAFQFLNTRVLRLPIPFHRDFEEVNLRFYVKRDMGNEVRRGVTFVKELVPRSVIALIARALYNENYYSVLMSHEISLGADGGVLRYSWHENGREHEVRAVISGDLGALCSNSGSEFIFEHYWGYTRQRDGSTLEYRVSHPPWRIWTEAAVEVRCDFESVYGERFAPLLGTQPHSAMVAEGSAITVDFPRRLPRV